MLPAAARVRRAEDFTAVMRSGRRAGRGPLVVHLLGPVPDSAVPDSALPARAGFVVGRAVGNAVVRNRTKRRLRHLVRDRLALLPAGTTVVIRALGGSGALSQDELAGHLDAGLHRLIRARA